MECISGAVPIPIRCQITWLRPWHIFKPTHTDTHNHARTHPYKDTLEGRQGQIPVYTTNSKSAVSSAETCHLEANSGSLPGNVELMYPLMVWYSFLLSLLLNFSLLFLSPTSPYQLLVSSNTANSRTNAGFLLWPLSVKAPGNTQMHKCTQAQTHAHTHTHVCTHNGMRIWMWGPVLHKHSGHLLLIPFYWKMICKEWTPWWPPLQPPTVSMWSCACQHTGSFRHANVNPRSQQEGSKFDSQPLAFLFGVYMLSHNPKSVH